MYICLCKGISDNKIRELLSLGNPSLRSLQKLCQAGTDCGMCLAEVKALIDEAKKSVG